MKNIEGNRYHNLTVLKRTGKSSQGSALWLCQCVCGNKKEFSTDHLTRRINPVKSCGCLRKRSGRSNPLFKGVGDISQKWWKTHVDRTRMREGIKVEITIDYAWNLFLKQNKKCALTGIKLQLSNDSAYNTASLDRIDSNKNYSEDNVQWVHKDINLMKRTLSQEMFINWCQKVVQYNGATGICEV